MSQDLTEEEMRRALFGTVQTNAQVSAPKSLEPAAEAIFTKPVAAPAVKKRAVNAFTPRLRVTLLVGNEFEGRTFEFMHEADTLSTLLAEQEALKAARKRYKYVEVVSVKSM